MKSIIGISKQIKSFPKTFWLLNFLQMFEKMAYVVVLIQMPIYIAQKDVVAGMYLSQSLKGMIFFVWAVVQRLTPIFVGGYIDKVGYKKSLYASFIVVTTSYLILGLQHNFYIFLFGILLLGFGSGIFLPALQAALSFTMNKKNESTGWGIYFMLLNLGVFVASPVSKLLKNISWNTVFFGSAVIFLLNFIILFFIKDVKLQVVRKMFSSQVIKTSIKNFFKKEILYFILIMSGFVIIYMQFYETFPNFFVDWINTASIVSKLHLPDILISHTARGNMLSYEWIRTINSGLIILAIVPISWLTSKLFRLNALMIGFILASIGLMLCGISMFGTISILGIIIYTFGEIITNPKFVEQLNSISPRNEKASYLSYLNISFAIGLGGGALLGGFIYQHFGEKAGLALKYLSTHYKINNIDLTQTFAKLQEITGMNASQTTELLWNTYHPYMIWLPFVSIGLLSVFCLFLYSKKYFEKFH